MTYDELKTYFSFFRLGLLKRESLVKLIALWQSSGARI